MSEQPPVEKTPAEIRLENIDEAIAKNEEVISTSLLLRESLQAVKTGKIRGGQGNEFTIDSTKAEEKVSEQLEKRADALTRLGELKTAIAFKTKSK